MPDIKVNKLLAAMAVKYNGNWSEMTAAIRAKEMAGEEECEKLLKTIHSKYITILDDEYPDSFKNMCKPPIVIFYYGDISLIKNYENCIGYVGSRDATSYGTQTAKNICSGLAKYGYCIVSGLARGIDTAATLGALEGKGKAVAVLGNGIDYCYPSENTPLYERLKREGLVISEYPGMVAPSTTSFPFRNRIIAGLSKGIVVGEAQTRSGTLITVNYALGSNREIGCVPYHADENSACNKLIKEGAYMVESAEDVMLMIGDMRGENEPKNLQTFL